MMMEPTLYQSKQQEATIRQEEEMESDEQRFILA